jgi:hypothetical protein
MRMPEKIAGLSLMIQYHRWVPIRGRMRTLAVLHKEVSQEQVRSIRIGHLQAWLLPSKMLKRSLGKLQVEIHQRCCRPCDESATPTPLQWRRNWWTRSWMY